MGKNLDDMFEMAKAVPDIVITTHLNERMHHMMSTFDRLMTGEFSENHVTLASYEHVAMRDDAARETYWRLLDHIGLSLVVAADCVVAERQVFFASRECPCNLYLFSFQERGYVLCVAVSNDLEVVQITAIRGSMADAFAYVLTLDGRIRQEESLDGFRTLMSKIVDASADVPRTLAAAMRLEDTVQEHLARRAAAAEAYQKAKA